MLAGWGQGDAGKGTWAFLPNDVWQPNSAWFFPKLSLPLFHSFVSHQQDALWSRDSIILLVLLCQWDLEGAGIIRADPLSNSMEPQCFLPTKHSFEGCQRALKAVTVWRLWCPCWMSYYDLNFKCGRTKWRDAFASAHWSISAKCGGGYAMRA